MNRWKRRRYLTVWAVLALGLVQATPGCVTGGSMDSAGLMRSEVTAMPLREQYVLLGERYLRMQQVMAELQGAVSSAEWEWITNGWAVLSGADAPGEVRSGAAAAQSYRLDLIRAQQFDTQSAARMMIERLTNHCQRRGWAVNPAHTTEDRLVAVTEDGFWVDSTVSPSGQLTLAVRSGAFWGDREALARELADRIPAAAMMERSLPGEYPSFPAWEEPGLR